jgi:L-threonylcarbamoyladenylate synthase
VIACPTEAVWGLSCDPFDRAAVAQLLALKRRPVAKGLILIAADESQLDWLLEGMSAAQRAKLTLSWPGPTTWLIPHHNKVPEWIHGDHETVAVRVSAHPAVSALCAAWGGVLTSTSANPAGCQPPRHGFQLRGYFAGQLDFIVPGSVGGADRPSTIKDLCSDQILRR